MTRSAAGEARLSTSVAVGGERFDWAAVVDCDSGKILRQQAPYLAYVYWPFPGVFVGQRLDGGDLGPFSSSLPSRRPAERTRRIKLTYRRVGPPPAGGSLQLERRGSDGQIARISLDRDLLPSAVSFNDGSSLALVPEAQASAIVEQVGKDAERLPAPAVLRPGAVAATVPPTQGSVDYSHFCSPLDVTTYDGHWPQVTFATVNGVVTKDTELAAEDMTALHDDRDSEFNMVPDSIFAYDNLALGQTEMAVEWESVMLFPKHGGWSPNYPHPPPPIAGNHFLTQRDVSFQAPRAGDQVFVRGAAIVDCGHSGHSVEIHPPVALAWRHSFGPGIADYYLRASSYGWYPHVENFSGPYHDQGALEVDFELPDLDRADRGATPFLGAVSIDYTYSGYDVSDNVHTVPLTWAQSHPMANLFGGDWTQPLSKYFDVSVTLQGNQVHLHAMPKPPWSQQRDNPQRPALIGLHFMACVPVHDAAGTDLNGCVGGGGSEPPAEYRGQVRPAALGATLSGWFFDRHRPTEPLTVEIRASTQCDLGDKEVLLGSVKTNPADHQFTFSLPPAIRVCNTPSGGPVQEIVIRTPSRDERPEEIRPELFRYDLPGLCALTPDTVSVSSRCPAGTGAGGGFRQCDSTLSLTPYCVPGLPDAAPPVPGAPTGLTAQGGAHQISLAWQPNGAIEYRIYSFDGTTYSRIGSTRASSARFTDLPNFTSHAYAVAAANASGEGPRSPPAQATTLHCSETCASGCCTGETCSAGPSLQNGCTTGGQACRAACGPGFDVCRAGACGCHQAEDLACGNRSCGTVKNACGGTYDCGACTPPSICSGGARASCVCTPLPRSTACSGLCASTAPDGCGGTYDCSATCPPSQACSEGRCVERACPPGTISCCGGDLGCRASCPKQCP